MGLAMPTRRTVHGNWQHLYGCSAVPTIRSIPSHTVTQADRVIGFVKLWELCACASDNFSMADLT
jgi:hypothetical protein